MSLKLTEVMDKIKDRLTKVDPNNRKVIGIFQMKTGDDKWGKKHRNYSVLWNKL